MACIKKLTLDLPADCASLSALGVLSSIDEVLLINKTELASATYQNAPALSTLTMTAGTKAFIVGTVKKSTSVQLAARQLDGAPTMQEHTINVKIAGNFITQAQGLAELSAGTFVAVIKSPDPAKAVVLGALCGLSCTDLTVDSTADGFASVTLKTPEGCAGDMLLIISSADYEALKILKA